MQLDQAGFFDEKAAARILDIHPRTLRRWREKGLVACAKTPTGRVRYNLDDLLKAMACGRVALP